MVGTGRGSCLSVTLLRLNYEMPCHNSDGVRSQTDISRSRTLQATLERKVRSPADWHLASPAGHGAPPAGHRLRGIACVASFFPFFRLSLFSVVPCVGLAGGVGSSRGLRLDGARRARQASSPGQLAAGKFALCVHSLRVPRPIESHFWCRHEPSRRRRRQRRRRRIQRIHG